MTKNVSLKGKGIKTGQSIITVLAVALLFSCQTTQQADDGAEESFGATMVKVFAARNQTLSERIVYTGLIEAWKQANILPDVGGKIAKIYTEEGNRVQKGQLLAELDTRAADLQMGQARAAHCRRPL